MDHECKFAPWAAGLAVRPPQSSIGDGMRTWREGGQTGSFATMLDCAGCALVSLVGPSLALLFRAWLRRLSDQTKAGIHAADARTKRAA